jgi:phosphatidate cytidylyltransferase
VVAWYVVRRPDPLADTSDFAGPIAVAVYIGLGFGFFVGVRQTGSDIEGARWLMFLFADLWVADTFAMLFGALWGKRKFAPIVSPNKTMVGFWAGLVGGGIVGAVFVIGGWLPASWPVVVSGAVMLSAVGQLGDLFESLLKRRAKVKDISSIIPGHGGVLDRFDSALFAAPTLYIYLKLIVY